MRAGKEALRAMLKEQRAEILEELETVERALDIEPELDLELLRKFASGEGGRRTGDLIRRGFIRVEVTEAGRAALRDLEEPR